MALVEGGQPMDRKLFPSEDITHTNYIATNLTSDVTRG